MANEKLRKIMQENSIPQWKLGQYLGKSENTVQRMLRSELPDDEKERIIQIIEEHKGGDTDGT